MKTEIAKLKTILERPNPEKEAQLQSISKQLDVLKSEGGSFKHIDQNKINELFTIFGTLQKADGKEQLETFSEKLSEIINNEVARISSQNAEAQNKNSTKRATEREKYAELKNIADKNAEAARKNILQAELQAERANSFSGILDKVTSKVGDLRIKASSASNSFRSFFQTKN